MRTLHLVLPVALGAALLGAATPGPATSGYTVPLQQGPHAQPAGTVEVQPRGNQTMLRVTLFNSEVLKPALTLHAGADCNNPVLGGLRAIPLNPIGTGQVSQTIVNLPLQQFKSQNYVVDLRNGTQREQFVRACAHLRQ